VNDPGTVNTGIQHNLRISLDSTIRIWGSS